MRFLDIPEVQYVNSLLSEIDVGDSYVSGHLETYSCKQAGDEKRYAKQLDQQLSTEISQSPPDPFTLSTSPFGSLQDTSNRKVLIDLIATLNAVFPNYDFSNIRDEQFVREPSYPLVMNSVNTTMMDVFSYVPQPNFAYLLWNVIQTAISPNECDIYSYILDSDSEAFGLNGALWAFNYFFYNKVQKKVLFFSCRRTRKNLNHTMNYQVAQSATSDMYDELDDMEDVGGAGGDNENDDDDDEYLDDYSVPSQLNSYSSYSVNSMHTMPM